jgi:hypothetical protein
MSFSLVELQRLQQSGDLLAERYAELVAAADQSMHDAPAARALAEFQRDYANDATALQRRLEAEAFAELAARAG